MISNFHVGSRHRASFAALLALALVALGGGCHRGSIAAPAPEQPPSGEVWLTEPQVKEAKVVVTPVDLQDVDDTLRVSGRVTFDDSRVTHVYSPVSGRITRIEAQLGQAVKRGQVLAVVESPDIGTASSDMGKATADLIAAEHDFARQKELAGAHAASQRDLEQSEDAYRKARAELDRAKAKLRLLRTGSYDAVTQTYTLRAEIDGEVIARNVSPGVEVQGQYGQGSAAELFTVGQIDRVWVVADIYEMDVARVKLGNRAIVRVVAQPGRAFEGKVDWVSGVLDPQTRTAKVRCTFENSDRALKPEMYATVQISVEERKALAIPRSAVVRLGEQTVVFLERGATADGRFRFERIPVSVDEGEGSPWLPVTHGLDRGARIVTSGAVLLSGML